MDYSHLIPLIDKFTGLRILVVGDVILDEYLTGRAERLSREAPIPVLEFERCDLIPGGAANPTVNLAALGAAAIQIGVVGDDANAGQLSNLLAKRGIETAGLVRDPDRPTTTKTRLMAQMGLRFPQQIARLDRINRQPISGPIEHAINGQIKRWATGVSAIMVSDYGSGLLTDAVIDTIRDLRRDGPLLITADAQGEIDKYGAFDLVKCNVDEAMRFLGRPLRHDSDFEESSDLLLSRLHLRGAILITRGAEGITLIKRDKDVAHIPAIRVEDVYDTVGAGDTVLAAVTLALAAGASVEDAATLANIAAGIVIRKVGNYAPSPDELKAAVRAYS
ncbi:MAG TPA: bifunctional ADP-heptose synthase [Aggregatilineales bacterium]|nr:bifunctional ADP-heptose synthase [Aggregatilineales bacterium]